jgi:hypothetical protein
MGFVLASAVVMQRASGGFLVWRRAYVWTTPWIVVAFVVVSVLAILLMVVGLQKSRQASGAVAMTKRQQWVWIVLSYVVFLVLCVVIHDAVMKHTLW